MPLIEIAIALALVQIADGEFQTIVICLLGLIYCRLRSITAEAGVNSYYMSFLISFTSTRIAMYLTSQGERTMEDKLGEMIAEAEKFNPDPRRTLRHIMLGILNVVFVLPVLKICVTHVLG